MPTGTTQSKSSQVRLFMFAGVAIAFVAIGVYAFFPGAFKIGGAKSEPSRSHVPSRMHEDIKAARAEVQNSPLVLAISKNEPATMEKLILSPANEQERTEALRSVITFADLNGMAGFSQAARIEFVKKISDYLSQPQAKVEPKDAPHRRRGRIFAARLIGRFTAELDETEARALTDAVLKKLPKSDEAYSIILEATANIKGASNQTFEKVKASCLAKDLSDVKSCLMTINSLPDEKRRAELIGWIHQRSNSFAQPLQPLVFKILVSNRTFLNDQTVKNMMRAASVRSGEEWSDAFLSAVDEMRAENEYSDRIKWISNHSTSLTIRSRASVLVARLAQKGGEG